MKLAICSGPPTSGKTTVLKHVIKKLTNKGENTAFVKTDVQFACEDDFFAQELNIPTKKIYSGELCPDHCNVMILGDALEWAEKERATVLVVETAGLCLRCSPYVEGAFGMVVLEATSGMNLPKKIGPMLSLADIAVVTKIDLISQAEREVFRARILEVCPGMRIIESDALHGIGVEPIVKMIYNSSDMKEPIYLRGNPPIGTCTICVGKKEIGWKQHFGIVRPLDNQVFYRGE
ncbi:MAG: GTP-binding protein [Candidatus Omnitrophica bacterium]|jgi:Ni2+-binding GTPase involved in maturation of urease and hydrogenase|nr:GTP-binding protein [Candidatus Omnitrophota bacterium]MDD5518178.1 GTP-binding protein [Candidatus Omnitrophota bacterium]